MTRLASAVLLFVALALPSSAPLRAEAFADDVGGLTLLAELIDQSMGGLSDTESGAFIVKSASGHHLELWPKSLKKYTTSYRGAIPAGIVAIAHSHPLSRPEPSRNDIEVAQRLGLDMYVVTRKSVYLIRGGSGTVTELLGSELWYDQVLAWRKGALIALPTIRDAGQRRPTQRADKPIVVARSAVTGGATASLVRLDAPPAQSELLPPVARSSAAAECQDSAHSVRQL